MRKLAAILVLIALPWLTWSNYTLRAENRLAIEQRDVIGEKLTLLANGFGHVYAIAKQQERAKSACLAQLYKDI